MNIQDAKTLQEKYSYLIGTKYRNNSIISSFVVLSDKAEIEEITEAANAILLHGEHYPDARLESYQVYVLFDLDDFSKGGYTRYNPLNVFLEHLSQNKRPL